MSISGLVLVGFEKPCEILEGKEEKEVAVGLDI